MKEEVKQAVAELKELNETAAAMLALNEKAFAESKQGNEKLDFIIGKMQEPQNKLSRILEIAAALITVFSIIHIIDAVINWIGG